MKYLLVYQGMPARRDPPWLLPGGAYPRPIPPSMPTGLPGPYGSAFPFGPRPGFHNGNRNRPLKRKAEDEPMDVSNQQSIVDNYKVVMPPDLCEPLHCKLCDVKANAPAQSRAHYTGRQHNKNIRKYAETIKKQLFEQGTLPIEVGQTFRVNTGATVTMVDDAEVERAKKPRLPAALTDVEFEVVSDSDSMNTDKFCSVCNIAFNSPAQAKQHYSGKNHVKKSRAVSAAASTSSSVTATTTTNHRSAKYGCCLCNCVMTSDEQLQMHLAGTKHRSKIKQKERQSRQEADSKDVHRPHTDGEPVGVVLENGHNSNGGETVAPTRQANCCHRHRDLSMYRTPSGKYYCDTCNMALNSETHFAQHLDGKKHKYKLSARKYIRIIEPPPPDTSVTLGPTLVNVQVQTVPTPPESPKSDNSGH